ncbi:hypothetical protein [Luteolibacter marinus]|uniref:hypothetical protein n=1 Tax=Luteolibacter marinus TaxID=2776705 RepID=UPI0018668E8B|nr:hypothetical protein [Luteolibacter marinus]
MNSTPVRRWNFGQIAVRWRHAFRIVPLLGFLAGITLGWEVSDRAKVATGIIHLRYPSEPTAADLSIIASTARSDEVLSATIRDLKAEKNWDPDTREDLERLSCLIGIKELHNDASIEIKVRSIETADNVALCKALMANLRDQEKQRHLDRLAGIHTELSAKIEELKVELDRNKKEWSASRRDGLESSGLIHPLHYFGLPLAVLKHRELTVLIQNEISAAEIALLSSKMRIQVGGLDGPLYILKYPGPAPDGRWQPLSMPVLLSGAGLLVGFLLSPAVAYLLEAAFPRPTAEPRNLPT